MRHYEPGGQLIATDGESMCSINHVSIRLTMDGKQQKSRVKAHNKIDEGFIIGDRSREKKEKMKVRLV